MTQNEQLDRLERYLQRFLSRPVQVPRKRRSRITAAKFRDYMTALEDYDTAKQALAAKPNDAELIEAFRLAGELLDRVREELKR